MRFALCLFVVVGCAPSFSITGEELDEVAGTCTLDVQFDEGNRQVGKRHLTVRPYSLDQARSCRTPGGARCDELRSLCTSRIGHREPVYESVPKPR